MFVVPSQQIMHFVAPDTAIDAGSPEPLLFRRSIASVFDPADLGKV